MAGAPEFVLGLSVVRGSPLPVIDPSRLIDESSAIRSRRFVTLQPDGHRVILAVSDVLGIRPLPFLHELPPLLREIRMDFVERIGALDSRLLLVFRTMHLVPQAVWASLNGDGTS